MTTSLTRMQTLAFRTLTKDMERSKDNKKAVAAIRAKTRQLMAQFNVSEATVKKALAAAD